MSIVHVVGNCTIDVAFHVDRFPFPGETLIARQRMVDLGGKGANQAVTAARFGARTRLVTCLGRDAEGRHAHSRLLGEGLDPEGLATTAGASDQSIIYVDAAGENMIVSTATAALSITPSQACEALSGVLPGDVVLLQGNLSQETSLAALRRAKSAGAFTMLNPAPIQWAFDALWPLADLVVLNRGEAESLLGTQDEEQALVRLHRHGAGAGVVTLGPEGCIAAEASHSPRRYPAVPVNAVDTAGAGDTFCGALAAAKARGLSFAACLSLALKAAAVTVSRAGTQGSFPSTSEAEELIARVERETA